MTSLSTPVAAIWTPKRIYLAAGDVRAVNDVHFAMTGLIKSDEPLFDAQQIVSEALAEGGSFAEAAENAAAALEEPLSQAVQFIHDSNPDDFKKILAGKNALDVLLVAKSHGETALSHVAFRTKRRGKAIVLEAQRRDYPNKHTSISSMELLTAGVSSSIADAFIKETKPQEALVYPEKALKKFMDLAIAAEPQRFGYPVNVVKLTESGATSLTIDAQSP